MARRQLALGFPPPLRHVGLKPLRQQAPRLWRKGAGRRRAWAGGTAHQECGKSRRAALGARAEPGSRRRGAGIYECGSGGTMRRAARAVVVVFSLVVAESAFLPLCISRQLVPEIRQIRLGQSQPLLSRGLDVLRLILRSGADGWATAIGAELHWLCTVLAARLFALLVPPRAPCIVVAIVQCITVVILSFFSFFSLCAGPPLHSPLLAPSRSFGRLAFPFRRHVWRGRRRLGSWRLCAQPLSHKKSFSSCAGRKAPQRHRQPTAKL